MSSLETGEIFLANSLAMCLNHDGQPSTVVTPTYMLAGK